MEIACVRMTSPTPDSRRRRPSNPLARRVLSPEEYRRLLKAVPDRRSHRGARLEAIVRLMAEVGLRVSEALALRPSDFSDEGGTIRLYATRTKGGRPRVVEVSPSVWDAVSRLCWRLGLRRGDDHPLFRGWSRVAVHHALRRLGERAGIPRLHPHALRHSFATWALDAGALLATQHALGHRKASTTSIYLHLTQSNRGAAERAVATVLGKPSGTL